MQLSHSRPIASAVFDDPNLVSPAGLVPVMGLARRAGLRQLADEWLSVPTDKGANPGLKVSSLVAGMVAGADSIDDMALLRHGGMSMVFDVAYAPSTLGSFLREFTFGHVRQADAVASRFLINLAEHTALLGRFGAEAATETVMVDIDDTIVEVHGYQKQGAGFGYSGVRGLNALLATVSTQTIAPVITAQRLREGSVGSPRGASRLTTDPAEVDTVTADATHRRHAIIENVHADLKASALAHLPSGVFNANAAWLVCAVMAFNLTRAAATITGPSLARATTATIRRKIITVPARIATSARRLHLHLPAGWPWAGAWIKLFDHACGPPPPATT